MSVKFVKEIRKCRSIFILCNIVLPTPGDPYSPIIVIYFMTFLLHETQISISDRMEILIFFELSFDELLSQT